MTNQQIMDHGNQMMDETDQAIERGKKVGLYPFSVTCYFFFPFAIYALFNSSLFW